MCVDHLEDFGVNMVVEVPPRFGLFGNLIPPVAVFLGVGLGGVIEDDNV